MAQLPLINIHSTRVYADGLSNGEGMARSSAYSAHFSIRGGRHDETLILLDGLELYEPYHLKDFNEGARYSMGLSFLNARATGRGPPRPSTRVSIEAALGVEVA